MQDCENCRKAQLKSQGLLERVSRITSNYENEIADLRVELTMLVQQLQENEEEPVVVPEEDE